MIIANKTLINPTIFPDGTSQVWKLPDVLLNAWEVNVVWHFESEAEIMHLLSLRRLLYSNPMSLRMPFLPYSRQDKEVSNMSTFNLEVFADVLNTMRFTEVRSVDTHNPKKASELIKNFVNVDPDEFHDRMIKLINPTITIFPDAGAHLRYAHREFNNTIIVEKRREPKSGRIIDVRLENYLDVPRIKGRALILDDLCDGGATFIMCANTLKKIDPNIEIHLAVTHGIFSRGLKPLQDAGIIVHCYNNLNKTLGDVNVD